LLFLLAPALVLARVEYKIVTASERGTYIQMAAIFKNGLQSPPA